MSGDNITKGVKSTISQHPRQTPASPSRPQRENAANVPRLALTKAEAAASLGLSVDSFERHVQPELRLVRRGRLVLVPAAELSRWLERNAALTLAS